MCVISRDNITGSICFSLDVSGRTRSDGSVSNPQTLSIALDRDAQWGASFADGRMFTISLNEVFFALDDL